MPDEGDYRIFKFLEKNHEYVSETACTINILPIPKNDVINSSRSVISPSLLSDLCIYLTDGMLFFLFFS